MSPIKIGPRRIADTTGTHEPGDVIDFPHPDLVALANSGATDPDSGLPYAETVRVGRSRKEPPPDPTEDEPATEPEAEPTPEETPETAP